MYKCYITNVQVLNQNCGYGEGKTWPEALKNALEQARKHLDPNAYVLGNCVVVDVACGL